MAEARPHLLLVPAFLGGHGGLENHVLAHARIGAEAGYRVTVVTPRPIPPGGELGPRLAEWATVTDAERAWRARPAARLQRALAGARATVADRRLPDTERRATLALDRARPTIERYWRDDGAALLASADLVHAYGKPKAFVANVVTAAADAGVPVLYNEIAQVTAAYARRPDLAGFARVANRCDGVVVMAESQAEDVRRHFGYRGEVTVVEQWADELEDDLLAVARPDPAGDDGPVVIGSLCRLSPEKGLDTLLAAFARVAADRPAAVLAVAGTGALDGPLRARAAELGIADRVDFRGFVEDRVAFYRGLDLFTVCSIEEGGPITGVEAMAAALPVVTTPCGAMPDRVRDGDEGLRVAVGDVDGLATALTRLVDDPALRRSLGAAARERYRERNTEAANRRRLVALWSEVRAAHGRPAPTPAVAAS